MPKSLEDSVKNESIISITEKKEFEEKQNENEINKLSDQNQTTSGTPSLSAIEYKITPIENCYLVLKFFSRLGVEKETFQTKVYFLKINSFLINKEINCSFIYCLFDCLFILVCDFRR